MAGPFRNIQTDFTGGELSPRMAGRIDLDQYDKSLAEATNCYILPHGGCTKRPGSLYVGTSLMPGTFGAPRLMPFVFSRTSAFILIFSRRLGGSAGAPAPVEFVSRQDKDNFLLNGAYQTVDIGSTADVPSVSTGLISGSTYTFGVTINGSAEQTMSFAGTNAGTYLDLLDELNADISGGYWQLWNKNLRCVTCSLNASTASVSISSVGAVSNLNSFSQLESPALASHYWINHPFSPHPGASGLSHGDFDYAQDGDAMVIAHPAVTPQIMNRLADREWTIAPLEFEYFALQDQQFKSAFVNFDLFTAEDGVAAFSVGDEFEFTTDGLGNFVSGSWVSGPASATDITNIEVNPDLDPGQVWNIECVFSTKQRQEFTVQGTATGTPVARWSDANFPGTVSFHEQRLFFGGPDRFPQSIIGSRTGDFTRLTIGPQENDAIDFDFQTNTYDPILGLITSRVLLVFGYGGEHTIEGGGLSGGISPSAARLRTHTNNGIRTRTKPIKVGQEILFLDRTGKRMRAVTYDLNVDANSARDLTLLSEHITTGSSASVVGQPLPVSGRYTYQPNPDTLVWITREDGIFLSLIHRKENGVTAWTRNIMQTASGISNVTDFATIPDDTEDLTYFNVRRIIGGSTFNYIERFDYELAQDSARKYGPGWGQFQDPVGSSYTNLDHLEGQVVSLLIDDSNDGVATVVGGSVTPPTLASNKASIGLPYTMEMKMLHPEQPTQAGTSQGAQVSIAKAVVRVQDTIGLTVDGLVQPVITSSTLMDTPPQPFTGDYFVRLFGGHEYPNNLPITHDLPFKATVISVVRFIEVEDT